MSATTVAPVPQQAPPRSPDLWHNAATLADLAAALRGEAYTAACGAKCHGRRGVARLRRDLPTMQQCMVCAEVLGVISLGGA